MRTVFIDTSSVRPVASGTGRYTQNLAEGLAQRYEVVTSPGNWHPQTRQMPEGPRDWHRELNFRLAANQPNIHADAGIFPNYFMPPGWPYPAAVTIHDLSFLTHPQCYSPRMRHFYRLRIRHTLKHARVILTVSEASRRQIVALTGISPERVLVHAPALPVTCCNPVPVHEEPYLLYVGNLEPKKNIENMLRAFALLRKQQKVSLVLAGRFHGQPAWNRKIRDLIREIPGVSYAGFVDDTRHADLLAFASGLVLVSHIEGFGLPVMDALANQVPVLISRDPALHETAAGHALITDASDPAQIARGMGDLLDIPAAELAGAARHMRRRFSPETRDTDMLRITRSLRTPRPLYLHGEPELKRETCPNTALLSGIAYADVFGSGITPAKLHRALSGVRLSKAMFDETLDRLLSLRPDLVVKEKGVLFWGVLREVTEGPRWAQSSADVRRRHARLLGVLMASPWVRGLYYSGGTAHGSGLDAQPDLDLLVIAAPGRAWLAWVWVRLVSLLGGPNSRICANYILAENAQEVHWQRDYYTAFQLLFLRKVSLKPGCTYIRRHNRWITDFFPNNSYTEAPAVPEVPRGLLTRLNLTLQFVAGWFWNRRGLRSGKGGLLWDAHRIKLHTNDHRPTVKQAFAERMRRFGGLPTGSAAASVRAAKMR